jgi:hypothetical protein
LDFGDSFSRSRRIRLRPKCSEYNNTIPLSAEPKPCARKKLCAKRGIRVKKEPTCLRQVKFRAKKGMRVKKDPTRLRRVKLHTNNKIKLYSLFIKNSPSILAHTCAFYAKIGGKNFGN